MARHETDMNCPTLPGTDTDSDIDRKNRADGRHPTPTRALATGRMLLPRGILDGSGLCCGPSSCRGPAVLERGLMVLMLPHPRRLDATAEVIVSIPYIAVDATGIGSGIREVFFEFSLFPMQCLCTQHQTLHRAASIPSAQEIQRSLTHPPPPKHTRQHPTARGEPM